MILEETINNINEEVERREKEAYQKGLIESWNLASTISCMNAKKQFKIFNESGDANIFGCYTVQGALDKLKEYEQKQNNIKVGDEVYFCDEHYTRVVTCITKTNGKNPTAVQLTKSGKWAVDDVTELHKTGRHFDQIEEVLKALNETKESEG